MRSQDNSYIFRVKEPSQRPYSDRAHMAFYRIPTEFSLATFCTLATLSLRSFFGNVSLTQLVASVSYVVLGGSVMVVGSNLARGKIFTASFIIYLCVYIYKYI